MYNTMNSVSARPYSNNRLGYNHEEEAEKDKTQDSLQGDNNNNGNNKQREPQTIASGKASDIIRRPSRRKNIPTTVTAPRTNVLNQPQNETRNTQNIQNQNVNVQNRTVSTPIAQNNLYRPSTQITNNSNVTSPINRQQTQTQQTADTSEVAPPDSRPATATSNRINIAQILKDFRNTINAIGTPDILREEVEDYLHEIEENTMGEAPSINLVQTNLMNGAAILDRYISETLNKESKVVVKWLDALFLQRINYHYDDGEVNKAFLVKFPESEEEKRAKAEKLEKEQQKVQEETIVEEQPVQYEPIQDTQYETIEYSQEPIEEYQEYKISNEIQQAQPQVQQKKVEYKKPEVTIIPEDNELKSLFIQAKRQAFANNPSKAMNIFHKALERAEDIKDGESQSKICLEMGNLYGENDYVVQALRSYNKSLKSTTDNALKSKAHYSMAKIYDEVNQTEPALNHYMNTVSYSGECDDLTTQCTSLTKIANIFSDQRDRIAFDFYDEANTLISQTKDSATKGFVSSNTATGYTKFNENIDALKYYANAVKNYSEIRDENNVAENYKAAAELMLKLDNPAKAKVLLNKALTHSDKAKDALLIDEINTMMQKIA